MASPATAPAADPQSDAPEPTFVAGSSRPLVDAASYAEALARWRDAGDINAWIGARFRYDPARALRLSETQRQRNGTLPIAAPAAFFAQPHGVCVDLSRFGVETLRQLDPSAKARYLMIEFDPLVLSGQTLRRHWVAVYEAGGQLYVFADSKRPGHVDGPYASTAQFIAAYAAYRGRRIVAFQERDSFERQMRRVRRATAASASAEAGPAAAGGSPQSPP